MKTKITICLVLVLSILVIIFAGCEKTASVPQPVTPVSTGQPTAVEATPQPVTTGINMSSSASESTLTVNTTETVSKGMLPK
jgi:uncharacterized protein YpuA (DUF1002 family)